MRDTGESDAVGALVSHWLLRLYIGCGIGCSSIGNACYGLQGTRDTGESDAVGALVSALATKIRTSMRYWMLKHW